MTDAPETCPVHDWATDYDIFDPGYVRDPAPVWDDLRERCPIAHTTRWGGSWMPTRYEDLQQLVKMVPELSSRSAVVVPPSPELREVLVAEAKKYGSENPPITADPPEHQPFRRLILPFFSPRAVEEQIPYTRELCNSLIDGFAGKGEADAAADYAQQITPRVIAHVLGIDPARADDFVTWVRGILELGQTQPEMRIKYRGIIRDFFQEMVTERRKNPRDDAISTLIEAEVAGEYERNTGLVIVEAFADGGISPDEVAAVLVANHGPFTWGADGQEAVARSEMLELLSRMECTLRAIAPEAPRPARHLIDRHFLRKHGRDAYYGQE